MGIRGAWYVTPVVPLTAKWLKGARYSSEPFVGANLATARLSGGSLQSGRRVATAPKNPHNGLGRYRAAPD